MISDDDCADIASHFGIDLDAERKQVLTCLTTADIRACPGSGKTTLLTAKLAVLTRKWQSRSEGICVMSHTNVARREIQARFAAAPSLHRLNAYPHFVGTIQSFVHQFLAIPAAVERFGRRPSSIDNLQFRVEACRESKSPRYKALRMAIDPLVANNPQKSTDDVIGDLHYTDALLTVSPLPGRLANSGPDTKSTRLRDELKASLSSRGVFRYDDMNALAEWYLNQRPEVVIALASRFPIVFVDETQDTSGWHSRLLELAFSTAAIVQRFGDDRQAIYHEGVDGDGGGDFPKGVILPMATSFRLSPKVANLVHGFCKGTPEPIEGNANRTDASHTIFLFDSSSITRVLPAYAELVGRELGPELPARDVRAVGAVQKEERDPSKLPVSVRDYWSEFESSKRKPPVKYDSFGGYLWEAKTHAASGQCGETERVILEGICRLLRIQGDVKAGIDCVPTRLLASQALVSPDSARDLRRHIAELCLWLPLISRLELQGQIERIKECVRKIIQGEWKESGNAFWSLGDSIPVACNVPDQAGSDVYKHQTASGPVRVKVGTIHSIKGETVRAVLIVETFQYEHQLRQLLEAGYLYGDRPRKAPSKRLHENLKRTFVAASRPTDLLCYAMLREHAESHVPSLEAIGWRVEHV